MTKINIRKKAFIAFLAILFFIFSFLFIFLLAIGFAIFCALGGIAIIAIRPMIITIMLGLGFMSMGILVLVFLLKFIFKKHKIDRSRMIEIFESDEPELFKLVRELTNEIKTDFPKKIYLTQEVNASVFYDSSFWSMFMPIRKNLQIGLGLVNSITDLEFKAILAHEFGHFSQKSMKIGSYVYNLNQIIYNLLYDNQSYNSIITGWARTSGYFALFTKVVVELVEGIRILLRKLYKIINLSYLDLSREMEFHADEVAASVAGSASLANALMRLDFADVAYNKVLDFYDLKISENIKTANIYPQHLATMEYMAKCYQLQMEYSLPQIREEDIGKANKALLVIQNQWASHPSIKERVNRLKELNYKTQLSNNYGWMFFKDRENVQKKITQKIFDPVKYKGQTVDLSLENYCLKLNEQENIYSFDPRYKRFYDARNIHKFDLWSTILEANKENTFTLEEIFNISTIDLLNTQRGMSSDIHLLTQIASDKIKINTFDYDGKKYKKEESQELLNKLKKRKENLDKEINSIDKKSFSYFYHLAKEKGNENILKEKYETYFSAQETFSKDIDLYNKMLSAKVFLTQKTAYEKIKQNMIGLKTVENELKERLSLLYSNSELKENLDDNTSKQIEEYLGKDWIYFTEPHYDNNALRFFNTGISTFYSMAYQNFFFAKKALLIFQMQQL